MECADVSRATALKRMELLDTLGIGEGHEDGENGRDTKYLALDPQFEWPASLEFPEF